MTCSVEGRRPCPPGDREDHHHERGVERPAHGQAHRGASRAARAALRLAATAPPPAQSAQMAPTSPLAVGGSHSATHPADEPWRPQARGGWRPGRLPRTSRHRQGLRSRRRGKPRVPFPRPPSPAAKPPARQTARPRAAGDSRVTAQAEGRRGDCAPGSAGLPGRPALPVPGPAVEPAAGRSPAGRWPAQGATPAVDAERTGSQEREGGRGRGTPTCTKTVALTSRLEPPSAHTRRSRRRKLQSPGSLLPLGRDRAPREFWTVHPGQSSATNVPTPRHRRNPKATGEPSEVRPRPGAFWVAPSPPEPPDAHHALTPGPPECAAELPWPSARTCGALPPAEPRPPQGAGPRRSSGSHRHEPYLYLN